MNARRLSMICPVMIMLAALTIAGFAGLADGGVAPPSRTPRGYLTSLPELARRAGMTERTFSRVFQKETATTPAVCSSRPPI